MYDPSYVIAEPTPEFAAIEDGELTQLLTRRSKKALSKHNRQKLSSIPVPNR